MAFIIKKVGTAPTKTAPKPLKIIRPSAVQSPFRTNVGGDFPDKTPDAPKAATPLKPRPLALKPIRPVSTRQEDGEATGILPVKPSGSGVLPITSDRSGPVYEACHIGTRVTITNGMFPWVKHWKPGDSGLVTHVGNNRDPMGVDDTSHLMHVIKIDAQGDGKKDRVGQTAALFRWEFQIGHLKLSETEGRKVVYE